MIFWMNNRSQCPNDSSILLHNMRILGSAVTERKYYVMKKHDVLIYTNKEKASVLFACYFIHKGNNDL